MQVCIGNGFETDNILNKKKGLCEIDLESRSQNQKRPSQVAANNTTTFAFNWCMGSPVMEPKWLRRFLTNDFCDLDLQSSDPQIGMENLQVAFNNPS